MDVYHLVAIEAALEAARSMGISEFEDWWWRSGHDARSAVRKALADQFTHGSRWSDISVYDVYRYANLSEG